LTAWSGRAGALPPRIVVAGAASGVGKTTVATGLMAALRARGTRVASAKVGPDFIDPGYHALATGRPARNLDVWMSGAEAIPALAGRAGEGADVLVVEGVMGMFDGAGDGTPSSTATVAALLSAPVLLVVDAGAMSASVAAVVHGFATFDASVAVAGVVLNQIGSDGHEAMLRDALDPLGVPVLGALRRDDALAWRDRHLGLVPVVEDPGTAEASLARLAAAVTRHVDLEAVMRVARSAEPVRAGALAGPRHVRRARIAVASGPAFSFAYPDNLEALVAAGAEAVPFDPFDDEALPDAVDGLFVGGGFPEVFVDRLAANTPLLADVRARVASGLVTWAECGGLLWLTRSLDGRALVGAVDAAARMTDRRTLGYRAVTVASSNPVAPAGAHLRGHEFHYSIVEPAGSALDMGAPDGAVRAGFATPSSFASYLHLHLGARPDIAERFVAHAAGGPAIAATSGG
jgi:cobyrinic acid a,c-diamide synthase